MARFAVVYVKPSSATVPGALVHATERSADAGVTSEPQRGREATCGQAQHIGAVRCFLEPQRRPPFEPRTCLAAALQWNRAQHTHRGQHAQIWLCTRVSSRVSSVSDHLRTKLCQRAASETCGRGVCDRSACRVRTSPHAVVHVAGGRGSAAYAERLRSVVMYKTKWPRGHLVITR